MSEERSTTSNSTNRIIISEAEYNLSNSKIDLTALEGERLLEYSELFKKFLMKSKFNYQIGLSTGFFKGREQEGYRAMDVCDELCKSIDSIEKGFIEFNKKKEQK